MLRKVHTGCLRAFQTSIYSWPPPITARAVMLSPVSRFFPSREAVWPHRHLPIQWRALRCSKSTFAIPTPFKHECQGNRWSLASITPSWWILWWRWWRKRWKLICGLKGYTICISHSKLKMMNQCLGGRENAFWWGHWPWDIPAPAPNFSLWATVRVGSASLWLIKILKSTYFLFMLSKSVSKPIWPPKGRQHKNL